MMFLTARLLAVQTVLHHTLACMGMGLAGSDLGA
jgi:hypothetical protein